MRAGMALLANLADAARSYLGGPQNRAMPQAQHQLSLLSTSAGRLIDRSAGTEAAGIATATPSAIANCSSRTASRRRRTMPKRCAGAGRRPNKGMADAQANTGLMYARGSAANAITPKPGAGTCLPPRRAVPPRRTRARRPLRQWSRCRNRPAGRGGLVREGRGKGKRRGASGARADVPFRPGRRAGRPKRPRAGSPRPPRKATRARSTIWLCLRCGTVRSHATRSAQRHCSARRHEAVCPGNASACPLV